MSIKKSITNFLVKNGILDIEVLKGKSFSLGSSNSFVLWQSNKKIPIETVMREYRNWPYAAAKAIGEAVAKIKIRVKKVNSDGTTEEVTDNELLDDLSSMNQYQTGYEVFFTTAVDLVMAGNAYWLLQGVDSETDTPDQIFLLPVQNVQVVRGKFPDLVKGYRFKIPNTNDIVDYKPEEILHFKVPDPNDMVEGVGAVASIAAWIDEDNNATEFNRMFFKQGARLGGFLKSKNLTSPEQLEYLSRSFEKVYSGVDNAHKVVSLPKDTEFDPGQQGQKDLDFAEGQKTTRDKILAGFRVPKTILGAAESDTNRATAEAAKAVFAEGTVKPIMELIILFLNEFLVPRYGDNIMLDFDDPTPESREEKREDMKAAMANQPITSINEAREKYTGLGPIENGDEVFRDIRWVPVGEPENQKSEGGKIIRKNVKKDKTIIRTRFAKNKKNRKKMADKMADNIIKELSKVEEAKKKVLKNVKKNINEMSDEDYEVIWKAFVSRVDPFEIEMFKTVQKFNDDQEKVVLENLENAIKVINKKDLFDIEEWSNILIDLATPIQVAVSDQEVVAATEMLGFKDITGLTPEAQKGLNKGISLMAKTYNETTLNLLKEKLEIGIDEGLGFEELKDTVKEVYAFSNDVRARQVARTEVFRAANAATRDGWKQTGVVKTVKWYTAADERVCEFCFPLHNTVVDIDSKFFNKGDVVEGVDGGELKLDYDDIQDPPLHVSCRCYTRPELIVI